MVIVHGRLISMKLVNLIVNLFFVSLDRVPDMKKYPPLPDIFLDNVSGSHFFV